MATTWLGFRVRVRVRGRVRGRVRVRVRVSGLAHGVAVLGRAVTQLVVLHG